jgi:hypothetical protein
MMPGAGDGSLPIAAAIPPSPEAVSAAFDPSFPIIPA